MSVMRAVTYCHIARTPADAPDIDGRLLLRGMPEDSLEIGQYVTARITDIADYDLIGEVIAGEYAQ